MIKMFLSFNIFVIYHCFFSSGMLNLSKKYTMSSDGVGGVTSNFSGKRAGEYVQQLKI